MSSPFPFLDPSAFGRSAGQAGKNIREQGSIDQILSNFGEDSNIEDLMMKVLGSGDIRQERQKLLLDKFKDIQASRLARKESQELSNLGSTIEQRAQAGGRPLDGQASELDRLNEEMRLILNSKTLSPKTKKEQLELRQQRIKSLKEGERLAPSEERRINNFISETNKKSDTAQNTLDTIKSIEGAIQRTDAGLLRRLDDIPGLGPLTRFVNPLSGEEQSIDDAAKTFLESLDFLLKGNLSAGRLNYVKSLVPSSTKTREQNLADIAQLKRITQTALKRQDALDSALQKYGKAPNLELLVRKEFNEAMDAEVDNVIEQQLKPVPEGTPITQDVVDQLLTKNNGNVKAAEKEAKALGYKL